MKILERLGLTLFSFIMLILAIMLIMTGIGLVDVSIFSVLIAKMIGNPTGIKIMYGACAVIILLAIRCLFFGSSSSSKESEVSGILLENENGKLLITNETIQTIVDGIINDVDDIIAASPKVVMTKDNDVYITVVIDVKQKTVIKLITSKLQADIKKAVKDATDIEVKSVDIQVRNVEAEEVSNTNFAEEFPDKVEKSEEDAEEEVIEAEEKSKPKKKAKSTKK